jgi:hypothetical protein
MKELTTITVKKTTLKRLQDHCKKGWTYDCYINLLMDLEEKTKAAT